jgi:MFS family permease
VQGLGEAIAAPAALSLVVLLFVDPVERAKAIGAWGGITAMEATLGVVLSGIIVSAISWRWIFFINLRGSSQRCGPLLAHHVWTSRARSARPGEVGTRLADRLTI